MYKFWNKTLVKRYRSKQNIVFLLRIPINMNKNLVRLRSCIKPRRFYSSKAEPSEDEPIKFSTSPAAKPVVRPLVKSAPSNKMPWYQPFSVVGSVAVFLIYFCYLREENDVDQEFTKTLYDRIKGLEKEQLLQTYKFNKEHGKDVSDIEKRLREIEAEEVKLVA